MFLADDGPIPPVSLLQFQSLWGAFLFVAWLVIPGIASYLYQRSLSQEREKQNAAYMEAMENQLTSHAGTVEKLLKDQAEERRSIHDHYSVMMERTMTRMDNLQNSQDRLTGAVTTLNATLGKMA